LLAAEKGLLKTTNNQLINHYYKGKRAKTLCHVNDSLYLVGLGGYGLRVWDQNKEQEMYKISHDSLVSIKRVMNTDNYILRTFKNGLKLLTINNLEFTLQDLLEVKDEGNRPDSLHVLITPSEIVIAAIQREWERNTYKSRIKLMKVPIV
jgi:hypothetical protein